MILHLRTSLYAVAFGIGMTAIVAAMSGDIRYGMSVAVAVLLVAGIAGWQIGRIAVYAVLPATIGFTAMALLYFIDNTTEKYIFVGLVTALFYASLFGIRRIRKNPFDMTARSLFSATLIATVFMFYAAAYGFYINFNIPLWLFLLVHFLFIGGVTLMSLRAYVSNYRRIVLYSAAIAFGMVQFAWMTNFWPFGYLTTAVVSLLFYYVLWDLVQMEFLEILSKKRVMMTLTYCIVLMGAVLVPTQWLLVN